MTRISVDKRQLSGYHCDVGGDVSRSLGDAVKLSQVSGALTFPRRDAPARLTTSVMRTWCLGAERARRIRTHPEQLQACLLSEDQSSKRKPSPGFPPIGPGAAIDVIVWPMLCTLLPNFQWRVSIQILKALAQLEDLQGARWVGRHPGCWSP